MTLYTFSGGVYDEAQAQKIIDRAHEVNENGEKLSATLPPSGRDDVSILTMQRLNDQYVCAAYIKLSLRLFLRAD